jgi:hypothetical protein
VRNRLFDAIEKLSAEVKRYNDANEPKIEERSEPWIGKAVYGEEARLRDEREELEKTLTPPRSRRRPPTQ